MLLWKHTVVEQLLKVHDEACACAAGAAVLLPADGVLPIGLHIWLLHRQNSLCG